MFAFKAIFVNELKLSAFLVSGGAENPEKLANETPKTTPELSRFFSLRARKIMEKNIYLC
jgi:hypothetical protein